MARPRSIATDLRPLIEQFTIAIANAIQTKANAEAMERVRKVFSFSETDAETPTPETKKRARQICPVPRCNGTAAPIFGMVCAKHKDVAKSTIKKYRATRKAKKTR